MKNLIIILLCLPFISVGQSIDKNYIKKTSYKAGTNQFVTYQDFNQTYDLSTGIAQDFLFTYGSGTIQIKILNDILTVTFDVTFPPGNVVAPTVVDDYLETSSPLTDVFLGDLDCGPAYPDMLRVSIINNRLVLQRNYMNSGPVSEFKETFTVPIKDFSVLSVPDDLKSENITYSDGLGRPIQNIVFKNSASKKNIVSHYEYDTYGRMAKDFLPFSSNQNNQDFLVGATVAQSSYYNQQYGDGQGYQVSIFESSPLNRKVKQGGMGTAWQPNSDPDVTSDNVSRYEYKFNILEDEVKAYTADSQWNESRRLYVAVLEGGVSSYYSNLLQKIISKNENWKPADGKLNTTQEFINMEGQVILKRNFSLVGTPGVVVSHDTYYVYDQYGSLSFVIPPGADSPSTQLDGLCYQYLYDYRNRLAEKKLPGKGWEYIVYDRMDRPVLTQDSRLKLQGKWLFTKYDALGRTVYTGEYTDASSRESIQGMLDIVAAPVLYETKSSTPVLIGGTNAHYSNNAFPKLNIDLFTINYYDNYAYDLAGIAIPSAVYDGTSITVETKSLPTGSKIRTLGTNQWTTVAMGYDDKARVIWSRRDNPTLGTVDIIESKLDFIGKVLESRTTHTRTGSISNLTTYDFYEYDHADRLLRHTQKIGPNATQLIAFNRYDELGMLVEKKVGSRWNRFDKVGVSYTNGIYRKTATTESWTNARIFSDEQIKRDGNLSFLATSTSDEIRIGFSQTNTPSGVAYNQIAFGVQLTKAAHVIGGKQLRVFRGTTDLGVQTNYREDDEITIEKVGTRISFKKNGREFYGLSGASASGSYNPVAYFFTPNMSLKHISISNYLYQDAYSLEKVRYDFNIRGWLTGINKPTVAVPSPAELFSFELHYNNPTAGAQALYNGNISQTSWRSKSGSQWKNYSYTYDGLNRLSQALFKNTGNALEDSNFFEKVWYDKNGNITDLKRSGNVAANTDLLGMDVMTYSYDGNRLKRIKEDGILVEGFTTTIAPTNVADQYGYDINGNMVRDLNKGIVNGSTDAITYNHLNLPTEIIFNGNATTRINYTYNALGVKLKKVVTNGTNTTTTEYGGGYSYSKGTTGAAKLDFIAHPEGYCTMSSNAVNTLSYVYQYRDHLGNVRLSYSDSSRDGAISTSEIIEENHYYPFGLKHSGNVYNGGGSTNAQKYKYNSKEYEEELGLNVTAMDFRQYDNATGRFISVDVLSEMYYNISPYAFARNNPAVLNDPTGLCEECDDYIERIGQEPYGGQIFYSSGGAEYTFNEIAGQWERTDTYFDLGELVISNDKSMFGDRDDRAGIDRFDNDFNVYAYTDNLGQMTNATNAFWGGVQMSINRARQYNFASKVAPMFGIGTQVAAPRIKAFTNLLGVWGNRIGIAGYGLSVVSIGTKVITGEQISTSDGIGFGINTALVAAAWIAAGTAAAPAVAIIALAYGAAELVSYAYNQKTLEQNILE